MIETRCNTCKKFIDTSGRYDIVPAQFKCEDCKYNELPIMAKIKLKWERLKSIMSVDGYSPSANV